MSDSRPSVSREQLERAAKAVRALLADGASQDRGQRIAALVHDVLSRQCEARTLIVGEPYVRARAEEHGLERGDAETELGNVLAILERGPEDNADWALLAALHVAGFQARTADLSEPAKLRGLCARLAEGSVWLELATPHRVMPLLPLLLSDGVRDAVLTALGAAVLDEDAAEADAGVRGRNALRVSVLADVGGDGAHAALERVASGARDPFSRALASLALGRLVLEGGVAEQRLSGRLGRFPAGAVRSVLRWVSGWALLSWLTRLLVAVVGLRRTAEVELRGQSLTVRRQLSLLGRPLLQAEQSHRVSELRLARRAARYPFVHLLLGLCFFCVGVVLGGFFLFDGARAGDLTLLLLAAALWLGGAGLDLALDVLVPGTRGRVAVELDLGGRARTRIVGVDQVAADRMLQALASRLSA